MNWLYRGDPLADDPWVTFIAVLRKYHDGRPPGQENRSHRSTTLKPERWPVAGKRDTLDFFTDRLKAVVDGLTDKLSPHVTNRTEGGDMASTTTVRDRESY